MATNLTETLVALIIMATVTAFTIPGYWHFKEHTQEQLLLSQLMRALELARNQAYASEATVTLVTPSVWQKQFMIIQDKILYDFKPKPVSGKLYFRTFPKGAMVLHFTPHENNYADNATFWYCRPDTKVPIWSITISHSARIRRQYPISQSTLKC